MGLRFFKENNYFFMLFTANYNLLHPPLFAEHGKTSMVWWMLAEDVSPPSPRCSAKSKNSCCGISHEQQHNLCDVVRLYWCGLCLRCAGVCIRDVLGEAESREGQLCVDWHCVMRRQSKSRGPRPGDRWVFVSNWKWTEKPFNRTLKQVYEGGDFNQLEEEISFVSFFSFFLVMQVVTSFNQWVTGVGCSGHERSTKCALNTTESVVLYMILLLNVTFHLLLK